VAELGRATVRRPDPGALWWWLDGGRPEQLLTPALRQATLDVLELGADAAAWIGEPDGGVARLTGYRASAQLPPELVALQARLAARTPGSPRPRLAAVDEAR
jgi:hypothetical protein